jgi:stage IV sporulation protein FB
MGNKCTFNFSFFIYLVLLLLILPLPWFLGALLAALVHELCHILAVFLCNGSVLSIQATYKGAEIEAAPMAQQKICLCALAGPAGSFLCLLVSEYFPEMALCGLVQGAYNLLPLYPLDGGRALRCICPEPVCIGMEWFTVVLFAGISLWLAVNHTALALIVFFSVCNPLIQRKFSCKERILAVQ